MKKIIAVVDDNEDVLYTIKYGIKDINPDLDVETFSNSLEFIKTSKKKKFDVILLDIMMPELNGWDTLAKLRENDTDNKETPVIFLTAKVDDQSKKFGSVIASEYLTKPFEVVDVYKVIKKYL